MAKNKKHCFRKINCYLNVPSSTTHSHRSSSSNNNFGILSPQHHQEDELGSPRTNEDATGDSITSIFPGDRLQLFLNNYTSCKLISDL